MTLPLFLAAFLAAGPAANTPPLARPSPLTCPDLQNLARQKARPRAEIKKLNQLPSGETIYAMMRIKDGCPDLTPVRLRR
jgi:hypothetical protein